MSALTTRDALAKALHELFGTWVYGQDIGPWDSERVEAEHPRWLTAADALIASGAVIDATTLADDEGAVEGAARSLYGPDQIGWDREAEHVRDFFRAQARAALAAALTERAS